MFTSQDIRDVDFANSVGGYKRDEVDVFLDKVETDYATYEKAIAERDSRIEELQKKVAEMEQSQSRIQSVLLNAQRLADQIVEDAKVKSSDIVADAQKNVDDIAQKGQLITDELDARAAEKKARLEKELTKMIKQAEEKKELIEQATAVSVKKQQDLYTSIKTAMSTFRTEITNKYKEHLQLLASMQTNTELDPEKTAKLITDNYSSETKVKESVKLEDEDIKSKSSIEPTKEVSEEAKEDLSAAENKATDSVEEDEK